MSITQDFQTCLLYGPENLDMTNIAISDFQDGVRKIDYKDFYNLVSKFQAYLQEKGIKKGSHILICGKNSIELIALILAGWRLSSVAIPVDYRMTASEIANVALRVNAELAVVSSQVDFDDVAGKMGEAKNRLVKLDEISKAAVNVKGEVRKGGESDFEALVILTSGTTGIPKGAVHTYESLIQNLMELADLVAINPDKKILMPLPASHIFGLVVLLIAIFKGAEVVFCDLEPKSFVKSINESKPNIIAGVPTIYGALLSLGKEVVNLDNAEVLLSGGAPLPIPMAKKFEAEFSKRLNNGYGSTECKLIALNIEGPLESVGRPIPSVEFQILDSDGSLKPEGEDGEIFIKSSLLMKEYLNQPDKTKEVLTENGYKTGDIGYLKDGYLFISGRAKEMIIVAGNKVFPIEVESSLAKHPLVKEIAVTGQDHSKLGQIVKAIIVVSDEKLSAKLSGEDEDLAKEARDAVLKELKDYSKENLKRELRPMVWDLRPLSSPLPKTRSGKIDKKVL